MVYLLFCIWTNLCRNFCRFFLEKILYRILSFNLHSYLCKQDRGSHGPGFQDLNALTAMQMMGEPEGMTLLFLLMSVCMKRSMAAFSKGFWSKVVFKYMDGKRWGDMHNIDLCLWNVWGGQESFDINWRDGGSWYYSSWPFCLPGLVEGNLKSLSPDEEILQKLTPGVWYCILGEAEDFILSMSLKRKWGFWICSFVCFLQLWKWGFWILL